MAVSDKSRTVDIILACLAFVGFCGINRFYEGKIGTGILWLLTAGCCGIGSIIDIVLIAVGKATDSNGNTIENW